MFASCAEQEAAKIGSDVDAMVTVINKKCPVMIDSETQLLGVQRLPDPALRYSFKLVHVAPGADTVAFRNALWPSLLANVKVDASFQALREQSYTFFYNYQDRNGKYLFTVPILPKEYSEK